MNSRYRMVPVAVVALVPLLAWWLYQGPPREQRDQPVAAPIAEDHVSYYLRDMTLTATREDGKRDYRITAVRMRRYDDTKSWTFRDPRWTFFMEGGAPWHGTADFGRAWNNGDEAQLSGTVHLNRPATAENKALEVVTSEVYLRPREDYASTPRPAVATTQGMRLRGIGAEVYMAEQRLLIQSHVETVYDEPIRISRD